MCVCRAFAARRPTSRLKRTEKGRHTMYVRTYSARLRHSFAKLPRWWLSSHSFSWPCLARGWSRESGGLLLSQQLGHKLTSSHDYPQEQGKIQPLLLCGRARSQPQLPLQCTERHGHAHARTTHACWSVYAFAAAARLKKAHTRTHAYIPGGAQRCGSGAAHSLTARLCSSSPMNWNSHPT